MSTNSNKKGVADCIRHFTPSWFAVNMGTGAVSLLFSVFPYWAGSHALRALSTAFFFLNLLLFVLFCGASAVRYWCFPGVWRAMLRHPVQGLYVGTFPMGALTLIAVGTTVLHGQYGFGGRAFLYALWGLWWADVALSCALRLGRRLPHVSVSPPNRIAEQRHALRDMTALWLLPVVTLVVASSGGGELALAARRIHHARRADDARGRHMHALGGPGARERAPRRVPSSGCSSTASPRARRACSRRACRSGRWARRASRRSCSARPRARCCPARRRRSSRATERAAEALYALAVGAALALWALATLWLGYALLGIQHALRRNGGRRAAVHARVLGAHLSECACGVYANLTIALAQVLDAAFFRVWGAIYAVVTLLLWIVVFSADRR
ncbi:voltage-dependent anion channel-domain-containing protein [Lactarius deliciosus]|nr:voltage-dependent anion channel-domain-containing protein [Lactarius deliciosus]